MPFYFDRVKETTDVTGAGNCVLLGAQPGYKSFASCLSINDQCYYSIVDSTTNEWEIGLAIYSSANVLSRSTILSSSNSNNAVSFGAGTKDVFMVFAAESINGMLVGFANVYDYTFGASVDATGIPTYQYGGGAFPVDAHQVVKAGAGMYWYFPQNYALGGSESWNNHKTVTATISSGVGFISATFAAGSPEGVVRAGVLIRTYNQAGTPTDMPFSFHANGGSIGVSF